MTADIGLAITTLAADTKLPEPVAAGWQLVLAALAGIALIVVLITVAKLHPFLALIFGALTVGIVAGENVGDVLDSFGDGFGTTAAGVGILIALGAMFAKLLADSGGADEIVDTIVGHASPRTLPWAMALVGAIIGLPMFFEIGLVLLMPVIYLVAKRSQLSLITVGIPALAGLSAMHGLVPPHPGPLTAIDLLKADLGVTLALGVLVAIPTVIVAGPLFGRLAGRWVVLDVPDRFEADDFSGNGGGSVVTAADVAEGERTATQTATRVERQRPSFGITLFSVLLPVALMMGKALVDIFIDDKSNVLRQVFDILGRPLMALLIAVIVGIFTLGRGAAMTRDQIVKCVESSLPPVAGIILIVAAGGGFKHVGDSRNDPPRNGFRDGGHHHRLVADAGSCGRHEHR
jgi:GntP family gluconate:H+ symporter